MKKKTNAKITKKVKKKVRRLSKNLVAPSKLPKDNVTTIRINGEVKKHLIEQGITVQSLFDQALDRKLDKLEFEIMTVITPKKD